MPAWLSATWSDAFESLSEADVWIVIGYSLPAYDHEIRRLFEGAHKEQAIEVWDPNAASVAASFRELAPGASIDLHDGLSNDHQPSSAATRAA